MPAAIPEELVLADAKAGLSSRQIGVKHNVNRHLVTAFLRARGMARPPRLRVLNPVGRKVTDAQAALRRRHPPLRIPVRTAEERRRNHWTVLELGAIALELRCGRVTVVAPGVKGERIECWEQVEARPSEARPIPLSAARAVEALCATCLCPIEPELPCGCRGAQPGLEQLPPVAVPAAA